MQKGSFEKQINLRDIWHIVFKRKWLLIMPFILAIGAAYGGSFLLTEKYQSRVSILVKESEVLGPEIRRITNATGLEMRGTEREIVLWQQSVQSEILSPATLLRVINELGMADDPQINAEVDELMADYPDYSRKDLTNIRLIRKLQDDHVRVGFRGQNLVSIMCESQNPLEARLMSQTLADVFREEQIREDLLKIRAMQEFSTEQLTIYKKEWEDAEAELADFKRNYTKETVIQKVNDGVLDGITAEIDQAKLFMEDLTDQRNFIAVQLIEKNVDTASLIMSEEMAGYVATLSGIIRQKVSLLEKYIRMDPKVLEVIGRYNRGVDSLKTYCDKTVGLLGLGRSGVSSDLISDYLCLNARVDLAVQEQITLRRSLDKLQNRYTTWPDYEIELSRLDEKAQTKREIYTKFNNQLLGSRINEDAFRKEAENRYKIIEPATLPLQPVYPNRIRIVALGCALGLVLGFGAVLLAEVLDNSLRTIEDTEHHLGLKVLGTIPKMEVSKRVSVHRNSKPVEMKR